MIKVCLFQVWSCVCVCVVGVRWKRGAVFCAITQGPGLLSSCGSLLCLWSPLSCSIGGAEEYRDSTPSLTTTSVPVLHPPLLFMPHWWEPVTWAHLPGRKLGSGVQCVPRKKRAGQWCTLRASVTLTDWSLVVGMAWQRVIIELPGPENKLHTFPFLLLKYHWFKMF